MAGSPANSLNINAAGLVKFDGVNQFSGVTVTQHDVLVGASSNGITSVVPGASGTVLTSNGVGIDPSFQTPSLGTLSVNIQTFTSSGTYTPTANMKYCIIEAVGGGGGGGGALQGTNNGQGGGGGGGEYRRGTFSAATIGVSQSVTIGPGGNGGSAGNNPGSAGTATTVGSLLTANPGQGGNGNNNATTPSAGGAGGTGGSGGQFNLDGMVGVNGQSALTLSGFGGNSFFGGGATKDLRNAQAGFNAPANKGGGGSGGSALSGSSVAGGNGGSGIVTVTEFIFA